MFYYTISSGMLSHSCQQMQHPLNLSAFEWWGKASDWTGLTCYARICIATPETKHILNPSTISLLPRNSVVINTSRGSTIDDDALIDALENKKIYAAGLDVFNNEPNLDKRYLKLDNCFVLPHIGSATHETRLAMSMMAVDNIYCYFNKNPLISEVV